VSHRTRTAILLACLLMVGAAAPASAASPSARAAADAAAYDGRLMVVWKGAAPGTLAIAGVETSERTAQPMRTVVTAQPGRAAAVAQALRADPRVLAVIPDARLSLLDWPADGSPSDPLFAQQGDLGQIDVPNAWKTTLGDPSVVVAVIDSGVDLSHPDLDGVTVVDPRNEVWNSSDVSDEMGHGTHVTGTIVAETNNALGVAGIAPASSLMPIKVADDDGFVSLSDVLDAVDWAREHGADIVNMSLGGPLTAEQVALAQPTFTAARVAGLLMVAAAGNDAIAAREYPASFAGVVSVSAVDGNDVTADFSNTGHAIDLAAPGVDLLSTSADGGYERMSGTSMAAPHVAGVAALVRAARPDLTVDELEAVLRASAVDLGDQGHDTTYGDGLVDAAAALVEAVPDPIPVLDPPAPFPPLTISFLAPTATVRQTASSYTVRLAINHDVIDSVALQASWPMKLGRCNLAKDPTVRYLTFGTTIELGNLHPGRCYQVIVAAIDEDFNYAEAISPYLKILDITTPRIAHRTPAAGRTGVRTSANVKVRFSEPVVVRHTQVRLTNARTGAIVKARYTWNASTSTLVLNPVSKLRAHTRYRVVVRSGIVDRGGNALRRTSWAFTTGS
jgi:Subtilase family/Bacterial Ig-like domain